MASFEELKAKYQSVVQVIEEEGVSLQNLHLQDGKLFMKGAAPSVEAANKVWDQINLTNPTADQITADFPAAPSFAQPETSALRSYTVKAGDTLSKISKQFYGSANDYVKIFDASRERLSDPDKIQ